MYTAASDTFAHLPVSVFDGVQGAVNKKREPADTQKELLKEIENVKHSIESVSSRFDYLSDPDLVEACIYEMKALNARYRYLTQEARRLGLKSSLSECLIKEL